MLRTAFTATCLTLAACAASAVTIRTVDISLTDVQNVGAFSGTVTSGVLTVKYDKDDPAFEMVPGTPALATLLDVTLTMGDAVFSAVGDQTFYGVDDGTYQNVNLSGVLTPTTVGRALGGAISYDLSMLLDGEDVDAANSFFTAQDVDKLNIMLIATVESATAIDSQVPLPAAGWMLAAGFGVLAARARKT